MRPLAYDSRYALNAVCPYFTMFPLEYPLQVLRRYRADKAGVIDPFCGRGTTLFAARVLGLESWGIDSSPVAVAITKAKLSTATAEEALGLAQLLIYAVKPKSIPQGDFFQAAFNRRTLHDICALREGLGGEGEGRHTEASVLLRAAVLGCLHGPMLSSGEASYFSNQMPRTFSPKPAYALRFWAKRKMVAPKIDVLQVLERKLRLIAATKRLQPARFRNVIQGDSTLAASLPPRRTFSVVVTSPPYYGMRTYVQDQWLRNWFLGGPARVDYEPGVQLEHKGQDTFARSLGRAWANMSRTESDRLDMYVRFGTIPSVKVDAYRLIAESVEESRAPFHIVHRRRAASAHSGKRQAEQMRAESGACEEYDFHIARR